MESFLDRWGLENEKPGDENIANPKPHDLTPFALLDSFCLTLTPFALLRAINFQLQERSFFHVRHIWNNKCKLKPRTIVNYLEDQYVSQI